MHTELVAEDLVRSHRQRYALSPICCLVEQGMPKQLVPDLGSYVVVDKAGQRPTLMM